MLWHKAWPLDFCFVFVPGQSFSNIGLVPFGASLQYLSFTFSSDTLDKTQIEADSITAIAGFFLLE